MEDEVPDTEIKYKWCILRIGYTINGWKNLYSSMNKENSFLYFWYKKKCSRCGATKSLNDFTYAYKNRNDPSQYQSWCRQCFHDIRHGPVKYKTLQRLKWLQEIRPDPNNPKHGQVRCALSECNKWFTPTFLQYNARKNCAEGHDLGEREFYCADDCKHNCVKFNKSAESIMKTDAVKAGVVPWWDLDREAQVELASLVLKRDNYKCQRCGSTKELNCHHIIPESVDPQLGADVENCITFCKQCHIFIHTNIKWCTAHYLRKQKLCVIDKNRA